MTKTVILPSCDDGNRGDQALVWQTHEIAKAAGLADECKMLTDSFEGSQQSVDEGIGVLQPILRHPSTKFSPNSNLNYGPLLYIIWGFISIIDGFKAFLLLFRPTRALLTLVLTDSDKNTLREIKTADACFVKGGGFIHTTNSISDPYKAFYFLFHVMLAQALKTPVYVMPNSFGPFNNAIYQAIVKYALNRCEVVTARESISMNMLGAIGVKSEVFPDLAFGLEATPVKSNCFDLLREENPNRKLVGLTARPYRFPGSENPQASYARYINEMAKFAAELYRTGFFPVFIEHVVSEGEHESDISAIEKIVEKLPKNEFTVFSEKHLDARQMKSVYAKCDYVVGTRFHSVIFALAEGTPALAIGYGGNKGKGIMKDIDLPENVVSIEDFTCTDAIQKFDSLVARNDMAHILGEIKKQVIRKNSELISLIVSSSKK